MRAFILGMAVGVGLVVLGAYIFVVTGGMPVSTKSKPLPFEEAIASISIAKATQDAAKLASPFEPSESSLVEGSKLYVKNCAVCHGLPEKLPTPIAQGLFPGPPELFNPDQSAAGYPIGGIYWVIKNGIRLTGMPGFESTLSDTEMWQLAQLLKVADKPPESVLQALKVNSNYGLYQ